MSNRLAIIVAIFAAYLAAIGGLGPQVVNALAGTPAMGLAPAAVLLLFAGILSAMARRSTTALVVAFDLGMLLIALLVANYARLGVRWHGAGPAMESAARLALVLAGGGPLAVAALALSRPRLPRSERWWWLSPVLEMPRLLWPGGDRNLCPHRLSLVAGLLLMLVGVVFMGGQTVERSIASWLDEDPSPAVHVASTAPALEMPQTRSFMDSAAIEPVPATQPAAPDTDRQPVSPDPDAVTAPPTTAPEVSTPIERSTETPAETPTEATTILDPVSPAAAETPPRTRRPHLFVDRRPTPSGAATPVAQMTPSRAIDHASRPLPAHDRPRPQAGSTNLDLIETTDSAPNPVEPVETVITTNDVAANPAPPVVVPATAPAPAMPQIEPPSDAAETAATRQYPAAAAPTSSSRPVSIEVPRGATLPLGLGLVVGGLLLLTRGLGAAGNRASPSAEN